MRTVHTHARVLCLQQGSNSIMKCFRFTHMLIQRWLHVGRLIQAKIALSCAQLLIINAERGCEYGDTFDALRAAHVALVHGEEHLNHEYTTAKDDANIRSIRADINDPNYQD